METATEQLRISPRAKSLIFESQQEKETYSDTIIRVFEFMRLDPAAQIGKLAERLIQTRKDLKHKDRVITILQEVPFVYTHRGSAGKTDNGLTATVTLPNGETREVAGERTDKSNYAHESDETSSFGSEELQDLKDQPVLVQLSYLYQKYGGPLQIRAHYWDEDCWQGRDCEEPEDWYITFPFPG